MLRIEFEDPVASQCECCGNTSISLTRFVYKDGDAFAVYYASFTKGHSERNLSGLIGIGEWGDDSVGPDARRAFPFEIRATDDQFEVGLVDAKQSPWLDVTFMGRILDREEALNHEWISDVFHITDHMVTEDKEIVQFFEAAE